MNFLKQLFKSTPVKQLDAGAFEQIRQTDPNAVVIDVRTDREFNQHQVPGALHINLQSRSFSGELSKLDKSARYLVYCRSGRRSAMACKLMAGMGFQDCNNLSGGILAWEQYVKQSN